MQCSLSSRQGCSVRIKAGVKQGARSIRAASSTWAVPSTEAPSKSFARLSVYKGKAALQLSCIPPTWSTVGEKVGMTVSREGAILFEFANVAQGSGPQSGYGDRSYDWENKLTFALKGVEAANLLDAAKLSNPQSGISLIHDPNINTDQKGQTTKTFGVKQNADGSTFAFTLSQTSGGVKTNVFVPVSAAELIAIQNVVSYAIPRLFGFDVVLSAPIYLQ